MTSTIRITLAFGAMLALGACSSTNNSDAARTVDEGAFLGGVVGAGLGALGGFIGCDGDRKCIAAATAGGAVAGAIAGGIYGKQVADAKGRFASANAYYGNEINRTNASNIQLRNQNISYRTEVNNRIASNAAMREQVKIGNITAAQYREVVRGAEQNSAYWQEEYRKAAERLKYEEAMLASARSKNDATATQLAALQGGIRDKRTELEAMEQTISLDALNR